MPVRSHTCARPFAKFGTLLGSGPPNVPAAHDLYTAAARQAPESLELRFWHGVLVLNAGDVDAGRTVLRDVFERDARWRDLLGRLPQAGLLTTSDHVLRSLIGERGTRSWDRGEMIQLQPKRRGRQLTLACRVHCHSGVASQVRTNLD